ARRTLERISEVGKTPLYFQTDASERAQVERMIERIGENFNRLDILVNNAGDGIRKPLVELEIADVEYTFGVCLWCVFHCTQLGARAMIRQGGGGSIVMISSVHAFRPYANSSAYNGAKAAVNQMAFTWAIEVAPQGIRVNVIEPGWIDTPGERSS